MRRTRSRNRQFAPADYIAAWAAQVAHLPLKVQANGYGHRIECTVCGWSKCYGELTQAIEHAEGH